MTGLQPALSALLSLKGPKKQCKKKTSAFDVELTNTNKKALKQYRAGRVLLFRPCNPPLLWAVWGLSRAPMVLHLCCLGPEVQGGEVKTKSQKAATVVPAL